MLAGTSRGASAPTLRTLALAHQAGRCTAQRSHAHCSGTLRPTPLPWLPVLCHIAPPHLRRKEATTKLLAKIRRNDSLALHADIENHPPARLPSRHSVWLDIPREELSALDEWCDEWLGTDVINQSLVDCSSSWLQLTSTSVGKLKPFQNRYGSADDTAVEESS